MTQSSKEFRKRQGRDFAAYSRTDRFNTGELKSTKRPYQTPKESGSVSAKNRNITEK
jgi:hypothetical protein